MTPQTTARLQHRLPRTFLFMGTLILSLLLLSLAAGFAAGTGRGSITLLFVAFPILLIGAFVALHRFDLLVMLLPVAALAVPFELPTGTETRLPAALLLTLALWGFWLISMVIRRQNIIARSSLNWPFFAFSLICCISLIWGILWRDPILIIAPSFIIVQIASLLTILVSIGAALLVGNFLQTEARLKYIVGVFLCFGSLMTITQFFHINQHFLNDRGLWGLWTIVPAYCLVINRSLMIRWYWRILLIILIAFTIYQTAIVDAAWVSGWVPTIVALFAATFLRSKKAFLVLLLLAAVAGYSTRDFFIEVANENINDGSLERLTLWEQNWRVVRAHWLFGTGPAGYAVYYMTYYRDDARSTHNNYLDILAQFGFSGMIIWIWLAIAGTIEGWRLSREAPPGFLQALATSVTAGWVGAQASMFFGDWVLPFAYNQGVGGYKYTVYTWLFLGTLISIRTILKRQSQTAIDITTSL